MVLLGGRIRVNRIFVAVLLGCLAFTIACGLILRASRAAGPDDPPTERTGYCANATCHTSILDRKFDHLPESAVGCETCHEYASPEQHLFQLTTPKDELCATCHTLTNQTVVHAPVADNNCIGCHDPHGSDHKMMLLKDPSDGLCMTCHDQKLVENTFVHGPAAVEACVLCHEPHSSGNPKLLTMAADRLCFQCHSEMKATGPAARNVHKPLEDGCTSCHNPHSSEFKFQLNASTPDLCFTCHEGKENELASAGFVHQPAMEEGGCAKCHDPHFTTLPKLQKLSQPELCLSCHNQEMTTTDGRTIANMEKLLAENPDHHGPIRDGECSSCHDPHASEHQSLLFQEYPAEFYAPYSEERYELCFSCHLPDLAEDKSGTGLTKFRDGDLNLHWLHVNQEKGRTCRACHEVHASQRPAHIRESVPFGSAGWMLEINYQQSDDGGSCKPACHKQHEYGRSATNASPGASGGRPKPPASEK